MKSRKHETLALARIGGWWMQNMVVLAKALHYGRAAQLDERNGFHYTSALEWRHAAELFPSGSLAADYCWGQWERIMDLPRPRVLTARGDVRAIRQTRTALTLT